jgi:hypothetical protein
VKEWKIYVLFTVFVSIPWAWAAQQGGTLTDIAAGVLVAWLVLMVILKVLVTLGRLIG